MNRIQVKYNNQGVLEIFKSQFFTLTFGLILLLCVIISILYSAILGTLILVSHIGGTYISIILYPHLPSLLTNQHTQTASTANIGCAVCGDPHCCRQRPSGEHQPWVGLDIPKETDQSIQDFLNELIKEFINSWYSHFSKDEYFTAEIRVRLRFACSVLLRRILRTDIGELLCERLVPIFLRHVDDFVLASNGCRLPADKVATFVSHLGERLHPASRSRQAELDYLRAVGRTLARIGLSKQENQCKSVSVLLVELLSGWILLTLSDTLCSPYTINTLIWLAVNSGKLEAPQNDGVPKVQFLKSFASRPLVMCNSPLRSDLNTVLANQRLLYALMQYLKRCGVVHILQFCLNVEDFNGRLLVPELSPSAAAELYKEAWDLYSIYLKPDSPDAIPCPPAVREQMFQVLSRGGNDIARLQTSTPLFQAFEDTFSLLEQIYLPGFYQSDLFFRLLCDNAQPVGYIKVQQKKGNEPLVSKISQRLQRFVTGQSIDSGYLVEAASDAGDLDCADDIDLSREFECREMTDWKVTIPEAVTEQDVNSTPYPVFIIKVLTDAEDESWEVRRKFNDFYTLQTKLLEFHQKLVEELPPKRGMFLPRGVEYLESRRQMLEQYLQRLIQHPELRCSDLLHCFLRDPTEFHTALRVPLTLSGVLRRSVEPMKLRKDRGRYLEPFLTTFQTSVNSVQKNEWLDQTTFPKFHKRKITVGIFGDNLSSVLRTVSSWPPCPPKPILRLSSFWDCLLYFLWRIVGGGAWLQRMVLVIKSILGDAASCLVHNYVNRRIQDLLLPRLPYLTRLLQNAVFSSSKLDDSVSAETLRLQLIDSISKSSKSTFIKFFAPNWADGCNTLLEPLQYPTVNKHLFYCLFDEVLRVLFSEFSVPTNSQL